MPIRIPNSLPATDTLRKENIFVMTENRAAIQDIRPLRIALLNLMPVKITTETQMSRVLGNTPLQVELDLIMLSSHASKNTPSDHLLKFYQTFDEIKENRYDGMIITGAPIEKLNFEEVDYWPELCRIMEWTKDHVTSTLHICWGAQAALYYHYGVDKYQLPQKLFGVFPHRVEYKRSILFRGFDDIFMVPHSRHTSIKRELIEVVPQLKILSSSEEAGVYAVTTRRGKQIFITGHSEYDTDTLKAEYLRDMEAGLDIQVPKNYFPNNDPGRDPLVTWRSHGNLLFSNWLNYFVYQMTPYDISNIR